MTSINDSSYNELDRAAALARNGQHAAYQGIECSVEGNDRNAANIHYAYLWRFREMELVAQANSSFPAVTAPTYVMSSLFLERCRAKLTRDEKEAMFYVTGLEDDGRIFLTDIIAFETSSRSEAGVHGDDRSVFQAVLKLQHAGQRLYAWFHSHPGSRDACAPSSVDTTTQQRLEGLNYPAIGAIFTRDGYLRFFSVNRQFQVQIYGKGVTHVDLEAFLYKIDLSNSG